MKKDSLLFWIELRINDGMNPTENIYNKRYGLFFLSFALASLITIYPCKKNAPMRFPKEFLKGLIGRPVLVKLKWGMSIQGILQSTDAFMNLQLTNAQEIVEDKSPENIGEVLIRCASFPIFILSIFHSTL